MPVEEAMEMAIASNPPAPKTHSASTISPLLSNLYMRRFVLVEKPRYESATARIVTIPTLRHPL